MNDTTEKDLLDGKFLIYDRIILFNIIYVGLAEKTSFLDDNFFLLPIIVPILNHLLDIKRITLILAIKDSLEKDGTMNRLHGEIRAAVMSVLNKNFENYEPPKVPEETRIINELLREYLEWNGYLYTEQILAAGK